MLSPPPSPGLILDMRVAAELAVKLGLGLFFHFSGVLTATTGFMLLILI